MPRRSLGRAFRRNRAHLFGAGLPTSPLGATAGWPSSARKIRTRSLFLESLEPRQMLTQAEGVNPSDSAVNPTCNCVCESGPATGGGNQTSWWAGPGLNRIWNYSLNARNPIFRAAFNLPSSWASASTIRMFVSMGGVTSSSLYYNPAGLSGGTNYVFSTLFDASSLAAGRYTWTMTVEAVISGNTHTRTNNAVHFLEAATTPGTLGGWRYGDLDLAHIFSDGVSIATPGGTSMWFSRTGSSNNYTAEQGDYYGSILVRNTDGSHVLTDRNGNVENFSSAGLLTSSVDTNARTTNYSYIDGDGDSQTDDISSITDHVGHVTNFSYTTGRVSTITDFAGRATTLAYNGSGQLSTLTLPDPDAGGPLSAPVASATYDASGRIATTTDPGNNIDSFTYGAMGTLLSKTYQGNTENYVAFWAAGLVAAGQGTQSNPSPLFVAANVYGSLQNPAAGTTTIQTDHHGLVTKEISALGHVTLLERNNAGRVTTHTTPDPDGSGPFDPLEPFVTQFSYDAANNVTQVTHPEGSTETWTYSTLNLPLTHTDQLGHQTVNIYDTAGNLTSQRRVFGEIDTPENGETNDLLTTMTYTPGGVGQPPKGLLASVTDPLGRLTNYAYSTKGLVTSITFAVGTSIQAAVTYVYNSVTDLMTQSIDELGRTTDYTYDNLGRLTLTTLPDPDAGGPLSRPTIAQTWNANGRMSSQTDALGRLTSYTYAHHGRVTSMTRPDHDNNGQLTVTTFAFDAAFRPTTVTDPLSRVTTTNYNSVGWVTSTVLPDPDGPGGPLTSPTTTYTYDNLGRVKTQTDPRGNVTSYAFANFGRDVTTTLADPDGAGGPLSSPVLFRQYDEAGNLTLERDALGAETTYEYDSANRLIEVTSPDPDAGGPLASPVTAYQYDKNSNLTRVTDALSNQTNYTYDARNRRLTEVLADPDGGGPLGSPTTTYAYNAASETTSLTDPVNNTTSWLYDGLGRVKQETNQLNKIRTFEYDAASNLIKRTDRLGRILQFEYDTLNHLTAEKWYNGTTLVRTLSFTYDAADQLLSATDPAATLGYTYDNLGRVIEEDQDLAGQTPLVEFQSKYSATSRRTELLALIGGTADFKNTYAYDNLDRLTSLQQQQTAGGNVLAQKRVDFSYDAASQYTKVTRYADTAGFQHVASSHYTTDLLGRLTKLVHSTSTTPPGSGWGTGALAGYQYVYDVGSRITSIDSLADGLTSYTHDNTEQLKTADHTGQTDETYSYDVNGNRTMTGYTTGTNNQLTSDGTFNYTYDDEGNRLTKTKISNGEKEEYAWDHRNRLTKVTFKNSGGTIIKTVDQTYDIFNRWIKRSIDPDGSTGSAPLQDTYFNHENGQIVLDFAGPAASDLKHRYLYSEAIDQILASEDVTSLTSAGNVLSPLTDHLGTTRDIADRNEGTGVTTVTNHRRFDSYGNLVSETNSAVDLLFAFTGRPFDESTALQNNLNRWYDAVTGQWPSEDPIGFEGGDGNLRRYVGNSPTAYRDPNGLQTLQDCLYEFLDCMETAEWYEYWYCQAQLDFCVATSKEVLTVAVVGGVVVVAGGLVVCDGPLPVGDAAAVCVVGGAAKICGVQISW